MRSTRHMPACLALLLAVTMAGHTRAQDVASDQESVRRAIHVCAACHGDAGRSSNNTIPSLAGQLPQYTIAQLKDFRSQTRAEAGTRAYMWGVSALLDDATIGGLAEYFAAQPPAKGKAGNAVLTTTGRKIFNEGLTNRGIRACAACHGAGGEGVSGFPRLAGQHAPYVYAQLKTFGTKLRLHGIVMQVETRTMTPAEMRAVAEYVQSL
jgi:cytochrome c553